MRRRAHERAFPKLRPVSLGAILVVFGCAPGATVLPDDRTPTGATAMTVQSAADGHRRVAEALGLVWVRCRVGSEFDSEPVVGSFRPTIQDGWYSAVETSLTGTRVVEVISDGGAATRWRTLFVVAWDADGATAAVPCRVVDAGAPDAAIAKEEVALPAPDPVQERAILGALAAELDGEAAEVVSARLRYLDRQATTAKLARDAERAVDALRGAKGRVEVDAALGDVLHATGALLDHAEAVSP